MSIEIEHDTHTKYLVVGPCPPWQSCVWGPLFWQTVTGDEVRNHSLCSFFDLHGNLLKGILITLLVWSNHQVYKPRRRAFVVGASRELVLEVVESVESSSQAHMKDQGWSVMHPRDENENPGLNCPTIGKPTSSEANLGTRRRMET